MKPYIPVIAYRDCMCQKKKEEEDLTALKSASMLFLQRVEDYIENAENDWLQRPGKLKTTQASTEQK